MRKTNFITLVKKRRRELDLSQVQVAKMCGIPSNSYCSYEMGTEPPLSRALIILKKLGVAVDRLELIIDDGFIGGNDNALSS